MNSHSVGKRPTLMPSSTGRSTIVSQSVSCESVCVWGDIELEDSTRVSVQEGLLPAREGNEKSKFFSWLEKGCAYKYSELSRPFHLAQHIICEGLQNRLKQNRNDALARVRGMLEVATQTYCDGNVYSIRNIRKRRRLNQKRMGIKC